MRAKNSVIRQKRFKSRVNFHQNADSTFETPTVQAVTFDDVTCTVCQGYGGAGFVGDEIICGGKTNFRTKNAVCTG